MGFEPSDEGQEQRRLLLIAVRHSGISVGQLWLRYFGIGGDAGEYEVDAYLHGSYNLPALQRDLLAHAVNEMIDELPAPPRAPYSSDDDTGTDSDGGHDDVGAESDGGSMSAAEDHPREDPDST
ncbi:hypothetical protein [Arthrobacter monumenti]